MTRNRRLSLVPAAVCLALAGSMAGCDCSEPVVGMADATSSPTDGSTPIGYDDAGNPIYADASTPIGYDDAGNPIYPDAAMICLDPGAPCTPGATPLCCSGLCVATDAGTTVCKAATICLGDGAPCANPTDCCSLTCGNGTCGGSTCKQIGEVCAAPGDCCSGTCTGGACAALPTTCTTLGETCTGPAQCCSQNCQGGTCVRASFCSAAGDICYTALDCCNGQCTNIPTGGGPGVCAPGVNVPGATQCGIGGEPCDGSENCCSRLCLDLGTGKSTCVLGSGCRERGEICVEDSECCGATTSWVVCSKEFATDLVGRCSNKTACQPVGNCCGLGANCEQACCDGKKAVCRIDAQGLSRCFGGGSVCPNGYDGLDPNCCIAPGDSCVFRDQCCNLLPCVPVNGVYTCQQPQCVAAGSVCVPGGTGAEACCNNLPCLPDGVGGYICRYGDVPDAGTPAPTDGGAICKPNGDPCTTGTECCSGTCTMGELGGTCTPPVTGYDDAGRPIFGPDDAGTMRYDDAGNPIFTPPDAAVPGPDAGPTCKSNGATCTGNNDCCSGLCSGGVCSTCKANGTACTVNGECCSSTCVQGELGGTCGTPVVCLGLGGVCTGTAECCSGLACQVPAGQPTGLCQAGSVCSTAGQSCSDSKPCCTNLRCENASTAALCAPTDSACVCRIIIN